MKLIDKDRVVAEIERRIKSLHQVNSPREQAVLYECEDILSFINTLGDVKEVDLEKELDKEWNKCEPTDEGIGLEIASIEHEQFDNIAKHFFELGLHSTITEEDCKLIWNIGDNLPYMPEENFFKELLQRYKAQKGEEL